MLGLSLLWQDATYAFQALTRSRARLHYALLAVLILGLGAGGAAAVFGIARGLLFDPLPYAHEGEVGVFWKKTDWTEEEFLFLRGQAPGFRDVALYRVRDMIMREGNRATGLVVGVTASAELFDVLGSWPMIGQSFRQGDDVQGAEPTAVLSYGLWQQLGGETSVVGSRVWIDGAQRTVIGVMPPGFWFPDPSVRVWTAEPLSAERNWNSTLMGRVAPGFDVQALGPSVVRLTAMLGNRFEYAEQWDKTKGAVITPIRDDIVGRMRLPLLATLGATGLILLISCANVGVLMLGQMDARSREFAVRSALGATQGRLSQLLIAEATLIACAAGLLGGVVATTGFHVVTRSLPLGAWAEAIAPDWMVFATAIAIALVGALLVVLIPALSIKRREPSLRSQMALRGGRLESRLVIAEVALAMVIASGATLLIRSVANLYAIHPGVRTDDVGVLDVMLSGSRQRRAQTLEEVTAALSRIPGVRAAAVTQVLPLRGGGYNLPLTIQGRTDIAGASTEFRMVSPGYLEWMGFSLRDGRSLSESDRRDAERVVVINEAFAKTYFPGASPIGRLVGWDSTNVARVIGIVSNATERKLTDGALPVRYAAVTQMPWIDEAQSIVLWTSGGIEPAGVLDAARQTVERVAPGVAVRGQTTMSRVLDAAVGPARQVMVLLSLLGALALTLGAVGLYGVIAHFAARREREWAIRVALGLGGWRVAARVMSHGALLVVTGIGIGVVGAAALARAVSSLVYGVRAIDPIALAAAGASLLVVGAIAAFIPARRASLTDPAIALREP